jgi:starvation-inducible DNA-binding protein
MYKVKNDLSENVRKQAIELLNARLSDGVDLHYQAKQAHWNVKGPNFIALHELFDKVADAAESHNDLMAERIAALGGTAEGTVAVAAKQSQLSAYPLNISSGREHVEALSSALASFAKAVRKAIDESAGFGDVDTSDVFTEISRETDKNLWFVEAHSQADR